MSLIKVAPVRPAWPRDDHEHAADRQTGTFLPHAPTLQEDHRATRDAFGWLAHLGLVP